MKKNKKGFAVLSSTAMGLLIASALTTSAHAAVTSYVVNDGTNNIKFNLDSLLADYTNKLQGNASPMFDEYMKRAANLTAFEDSVKGYVSYDSVVKVYIDMLSANKGNQFNIDTVTEAATASDIKNITVSKEWKDGAIKDTTVVSGLTVSSVSAINATTLQVVLAEKPAADPTADKFAVTVNGSSIAAPTAVTKVASDLTGKTYKLTIATLDGQQGDVAVNGIKAAAATGMIYGFDYKAPTLQSVTAKGLRTLELQFDEKLDSAAANIATTNFTVVKAGSAPIATNTAVLNATGTKVTITLDTDMTVADYVVKLGAVGPVNVKDIAGNGIFNGTEVSFRPTSAQLSDTSAPVLTKAVYDKVSGILTLTLSKNITTMDVTKLSINGVALTSSDTAVNAANVSTITMSTATKTALNALTGSLTLTAAKDAYGDANLTTGETFVVSLEQPAVLSSLAYDQQSNKLTATFDQTVTLKASTVLSIDDANEAGSADITKAMAINADGTAADTTVASSTWTFDCTSVAGTIEGMTAANLKAYILAGAVTNGASIDSVVGQETYAKGVKVTYTADTTKPTLVGVEYNNNTQKLVLTFSEKVDVNTAHTNVANIKLWQADGDDLDGFISLAGITSQEKTALTASSKTLTYDLSGLATDKAALELAFNTGKTVKATIDGTVAKDEANLMGVATTYATGTSATYKDYAAPTLTGGVTVTNKNLISVKFTEPVDKTTASNVNNYVIADTTNAKLAVTNAAVQAVDVDGSMTVLLTTATQTSNAPYTLTVNNVKDVAGNIMAQSVQTFNGATADDAQKLTVDTLAVTSPVNGKNDTLTVGFNAAPDSSKALDLNNYVVLQADTNDTTGWANATQVSLTNAKAELVAGDATKVKITLDAPNLQNGKFYKVVVSNVATVTGKALGTSAGDADAISAALSAAALPAPTMTATQTATGAIKLVFNQELDSAAATLASNYTVHNDAAGANTAVAVTKATYSWDASTGKATVVLDLASAPVANVSVGLNANIKNLAGVSVAGNPANATTLGDNVAPTVNTVVANVNPDKEDDVITVTFTDKDVLAASGNLASNYVVKDAQGTVIPSADYSVAFVDGGAGADSVTITFDKASPNAYNLQAGANYTVTITGVVDESGNSIATISKTAAWDVATDVTAPTINSTITSATAGTKTFTVTYDNDVDSASASVAANYKVEYSALGDYSDTVVLTPIFASYDDTTKVATVIVSEPISTTTVGSKFRITISNVKDLAGNVSDGTLAGNKAELTN